MRFFTQCWAIAFLLVLGVTQSHAQSSSPSTAPYLLFKVGYGLPDSRQQIGANANVPASGGMYRGIYGSYAQGLNLSVGIGKMINPTFGFEANAQLMLGQTISGFYNYADVPITGSTTERAKSLILKPMIVIRNSGDLLTIYTKLGLAVGVVSNLYKHDEYYDSKNGIYYLVESREMATVKVGFAAGFGLAFRMTESFSLLVEVDGQLLSLAIRKGRLTKFERNGENKLPSMRLSEKSWVYENNAPEKPVDSDTEPDIRLFNPKYYSYVGVGLSIVYHF